MELSLLREFIVLSQTLNYTKAAEILHLTQPTLSKHIVAMEKELGCSLLERDRRRVELTESGNVFAAAALQMVDTYDDGTINVSLNNRNVPELRMSRDFTEMVEEHTKNKANQSKESKEAMMFLKQKMDAAQGFIDAVKQRQNTLMTTMQAIIDLQRPFFLEGDESLLKPMILKDVAERTGLDISTISRVSNSKYVQTNFGIYPLKFFFSDGYTTEDGEEMSVREIRKILKECIDGEDKKKPLTDDELADILKEKGYPIARRTVAKYRQQLNIPVARLRK